MWGKAGPIKSGVSITQFEIAVKSFGLQPDQYSRSSRLRNWVVKNRKRHYVPEELLIAWGLNNQECDLSPTEGMY